MLTSKERLRCALDHIQPDRVPFDIGGTNSSSINRSAYERLLGFLGLARDIRILSQRSQVVVVDEDIAEELGVDTRCANQPQSADAPDAYVDEWGVVQKHSTATNLYIARRGPFQELVEPTSNELDAHSWPDPNTLGNVDDQMLTVVRDAFRSDKGVVLTLSDSLLGCVHLSQFMRGYARWLCDLHEHPAFLSELLERITGIWIAAAENILSSIGSYIDVIWLGDDLGTQHGTLMSPAMYRHFVKDRHRRMVETVKVAGKAKVVFHSCGDVSALIPDLIEIGVDALNPIQVSATNMDPAKLKREYGEKLTLWGTVDTQRVLPFGTTDEVRQEVRRRIEACAHGGGFVIAPVHNIQAEVPPQNVVAMAEAVRDYGEYQ